MQQSHWDRLLQVADPVLGTHPYSGQMQILPAIPAGTMDETLPGNDVLIFVSYLIN